MEPWQSRQARDRGRLSRSSGRNAWAGFDVLDEHVLPHIKRCHATDEELVAAEKAVAGGEEGTADRQEEHDLTHALHKSAAKFYLGIDE